MIEYDLIRSNRKTVAIHITKEARVEVRAPLRMPKTDIDKFISSKLEWINKNLSAREQALQSKSAFRLDYGDMVLMQGREYPVAAGKSNRIGFDDTQFYIPPGLTPNEIKYAVVEVYKMIARKLLTNKVMHYSKHMGLTPTAVKVNSAKTRWGSCSGKNSINFSWRLIMAEDDVIDYVVIHELAHIKEHNHSDRFWKQVAFVMPDYDEKRKKLKHLQTRISGEDWD